MSSVVDYFTGGISDTYSQTVDYWSKDNSIADSMDVISWSVKNPDIVKEATIKGIDNSMNELGNAVSQDTNKLLISIAIIGGLYLYFVKGFKRGK